jgi:hypothetical protein
MENRDKLEKFEQLEAAARLVEENELAILEHGVTIDITEIFLRGFEAELRKPLKDAQRQLFFRLLGKGQTERGLLRMELARLRANHQVLRQKFAELRGEK